MKRRAFSLVEVIVVIAITGMMGGIVTGFIVRSYKNNRRLDAQQAVQSSLNLAGDRFSRIGRSATLVVEATNTNFKIRGYADADDTAPSEINIYLNGLKATMSIIPPSGTPPNYTYDPTQAVYRTLLSEVTNNSTSQPLFFYYNESNTKLTTPINISAIKSVEFAPSARDSANLMTVPIVVSNRVTLRNFKTNL